MAKYEVYDVDFDISQESETISVNFSNIQIKKAIEEGTQPRIFMLDITKGLINELLNAEYGLIEAAHKFGKTFKGSLVDQAMQEGRTVLEEAEDGQVLIDRSRFTKLTFILAGNEKEEKGACSVISEPDSNMISFISTFYLTSEAQDDLLEIDAEDFEGMFLMQDSFDKWLTLTEYKQEVGKQLIDEAIKEFEGE